MQGAAEREADFRTKTLRRVQSTAPEMGIAAVLGTLLSILLRLLLPAPEYVGLRVALLAATAVSAYLIVRAPSVRLYGWACMATIATVTGSNYLGTLGTDRQLMYFLPIAIIVLLSASFFWITVGQWFGGAVACYGFLLPFVGDPAVSRADAVYTVLCATVSLGAAFVTYQRARDYQRRAFDQARQLAELSVTDTLTGARSRAEFLQQLDRAVAQAHATATPLALLYIDVDHFKRLNDLHGHAAGDAVLRGLADALQQGLRTTDLFGRLGGEEFCILLPGQGEADARALAARLRARLAEVPRPDGRLTVSAGIAVLHQGEAAAPLLHRADLAMLQAKQDGRDTVRVAA
ncbi:GGDEF domain-containing protein [uncultured Xylophilus sp.]|uniref:GGDEF domain-containing protein n=1 Tax=uncultured Xylophilus sp. TaxID=296832 RepID=UPI0025D2410F|nr:GGDEF domain-containing protein [uncultured Xylophilus sp.]